MPANVVDLRLKQAQEILEELLKPVVYLQNLTLFVSVRFDFKILWAAFACVCLLRCPMVFTFFYLYLDNVGKNGKFPLGTRTALLS